MHQDLVRDLLARVAAGEIDVSQATERLRNLGYENLGYARVDHHRELRQGTPEIIYGAGKTPEQIAGIAKILLAAGSNVLCTRASREAFAAVKNVADDAAYSATARAVTVIRHTPMILGQVGVLCAGTSDLPVAEEAKIAAEFFGAQVVMASDVGVAGIHRLLDSLPVLNDSDALIVVAGMEGALPSVVGGLTATPIVAVPTSVGYGTNLGGLTTLFTMLSSCAAGVTVVNIDNGFGAAAAAHRILARQKKRLESAEIKASHNEALI